MALSKTTQDHEEIRQWAEARGGKPAEVASTERNGQTGIIRIEFPGAVNANDSNLKEISWDEFFEKFDASGLALVYQEQTAEGAESNFNKLVHPENVSESAKKGVKTAAKKSAKGSSAAKKSAGSAKAGSAKKVTLAKKASATRSAATKKAAPVKKAASKATGAKKTGSKKTVAKVPARKAAPVKKAAAKKGSIKKTIAKKSGGAKRSKR